MSSEVTPTTVVCRVCTRSPAASVEVLVTVMMKSRPAIRHRGQFDVDPQLVAGHDQAVLLQGLFGLQVGVVADDHRLEHLPVAGHARGRG